MEFGYEARSFTSSRQALKSASVLHPDAVVCEVEMPELDGFALGRELRALDPKCKVLLLTEGRTAHDEFTLLQKPVGLLALLEELVDDAMAEYEQQ